MYTANCVHGALRGSHCSGELVAGPRYWFRAVRAHDEVLFSTDSGAEPLRRLSPCAINDGRNWICRPGADAAHTITLQMSLGRPVVSPGDPTLPLHAVSKWRWWLLRCGIALGHDTAT